MKQFIYQNLQPLGIVSGITVLSSFYFLYKYSKKYLDNKQICAKLKQITPVMDLSQYLLSNKLQHKNESKKTFVRIRIPQDERYTSIRSIPYHFNHKYLIPHDLINSNVQQLKERSKKQRQYVISDVNDQSFKKKMYGMGMITGQILKVEIQKSQFEISLWKNVIAGFAFVGQMILQLFLKKYLVLLGPKIGDLQVKTTFFPNQKLLLLVGFNENEFLVPQYTGTSKTQIIQYIKSNNTINYLIYSGLALIVTFNIFLWFIQEIKKKQLNKPLKGYKMLAFEGENQKPCIICNDSCRNVIFRDCFHLLLCKSCQNQYDKQICPLCRNVIKNKINVYETKNN